MSHHTLLDVEAFLTVAQSGGFTSAGELLQTSKSVVSRRVKRLEASLGVQLLVRTTRTVELTDEGRLLYEHLGDLKARVATAEKLIQARRESPQGRLRVLLPSYMGGSEITDVLIPAFSAAHPGVTLDVRLSAQGPLTAPRSFDVAIMTRPRHRRLADSRLRERRLGHLPSALYAAPAYLEKHGTPRRPSDLVTHQCLSYPSPIWRFSDSHKTESEVQVRPVLSSGSNHVLKAATVAGRGVIYSFPTVFRPEIERGDVVQIMAPYTATAGLDLRVVLPDSEYQPLRTTLFLSALDGLMAAHQPGEGRDPRPVASPR